MQAAERQALVAFGVTQEVVTAFQTQVDQASSETAAQVATLSQELQQAQDTVAGKVQEAVTSGFSLPQEAFGRQLEHINQELVTAPVQQLVARTQTAVEQQLRQVIDGVVLSQLSEVIRNIELQIRQAGHGSAMERQVLEPFVRELEQVWGPVKDAADHVHEFARSKGLA